MTRIAALAAANDLRAVMQGKVVLLGDAAYPATRQIWNGAVDHQPALFAVCETTKDVQAAVQVADSHGLPLSVRGGGHDWAGRALRHDGLVIDLRQMRHVEVEAHAQIATISGGVSAGDLISATAPYGLIAVTSTIGAVGMAGLTLGGGYGPLTSRYGLALDNLLGAEVVLANGQIVTANASENAELFWALRGGGGNFGVVTSMRVRLHRPPGLLAGLILFPWSEAEQVLHGYAKAIETAADELGVIVGVLSGPNGDPVLSLAPTWSGGPAEGERIIVGLQCLGRPLLVVTGPMAYSDLLGMYNAHVVNGRHYALQTRWVSALTPEVISTLIAGGNNRTSPFTTIALHHFNGAATRVPLHATAFGLRRKHFLVEAIAAWEPDAQIDSTTHRQWAHNLSQALAPVALAGGYPNLLGPDKHDRSVMLNRSQYAPRMIFGSWALKLLRNQRQRWDPNHAIRPDRQRFGLISCVFGLNSFLNIDRSVKQ
jgi:FAD binding domain